MRLWQSLALLDPNRLTSWFVTAIKLIPKKNRARRIEIAFPCGTRHGSFLVPTDTIVQLIRPDASG